MLSLVKKMLSLAKKMLSLVKKMLSQSKINIFLVLFIYKLIYITINSKFTNQIYNNIVIKYNLLYHLYNYNIIYCNI